ncbi:MAG: hypothetical protein LBW85_09840 [Deltaproteobacteria bacterium]|jgi:hypothetical protein|nr:hypothetical protein [Deltaproteobacteria bacterium]
MNPEFPEIPKFAEIPKFPEFPEFPEIPEFRAVPPIAGRPMIPLIARLREVRAAAAGLTLARGAAGPARAGSGPTSSWSAKALPRAGLRRRP